MLEQLLRSEDALSVTQCRSWRKLKPLLHNATKIAASQANEVNAFSNCLPQSDRDTTHGLYSVVIYLVFLYHLYRALAFSCPLCGVSDRCICVIIFVLSDLRVPIP
jgi:hypothetical protein